MRRTGRGTLAAFALLAAAGCADPESAGSSAAARQVPGGDPARGRALARAYGCPACHVMPGVGPTAGLVGPPLGGFASRAYIAGRLPNRPGGLLLWLRDPALVDPETAMPDMGIGDEEARHLAAYLYTLVAEAG